VRRADNVGMTMEQLAAYDSAERERIRLKVISDLRRAIDIARDRHARTDNLERHLAQLTG
jgi:hypothetical protein